MSLLLDTCSFLWLVSDDAQLSGRAKRAITATEDPVYLSVASLWEILVKHGSGKLQIQVAATAERYFVAKREQHGIAALPITEEAVVHLPRLPALHRDPFDRVLICQAIAHGLTIVTPDEAIRAYPVATLW